MRVVLPSLACCDPERCLLSTRTLPAVIPSEARDLKTRGGEICRTRRLRFLAAACGDARNDTGERRGFVGEARNDRLGVFGDDSSPRRTMAVLFCWALRPYFPSCSCRLSLAVFLLPS